MFGILVILTFVIAFRIAGNTVLHSRSMLPDSQFRYNVVKSFHLLLFIRKHLVIGQFSFLCFSLGAINRQTSYDVSFVKTTESYSISLVTIRWQTLKDSGLQFSRLLNRMRFAYWVTILVEHLPERTKTGRLNYRIGLDCVGHA